MKNLYFFILILFFFNTNLLSVERTEEEAKIGVFREDLKVIGTFKKIEKVPKDLFDKKYNTFHSRQLYSLSQIGNIFVKQKGLLEKYPERMMRGMAYFEFFYQQQLKDNENIIRRFNVNYPSWDSNTNKTMRKLYSLNKARKSMRNALGFSLEDDTEKVLLGYDTMYKLFKQSETSKNKLNKKDKEIRRFHNEISKQIGKAKTLVEKKNEFRITNKKFLKEYSKIKKKLTNALKKAEFRKEYELLSSFVIELHNLVEKDNSALLSGYNLTTFILKDLKSSVVKKKFEQNLKNANFDIFSQEELVALGEITKSNKLKKNEDSKKIQVDILNLENNKIPVSKLLDVYRKDLDIKLDSLNLQLASKVEMQRWALSDWANAWKTPIPTKVLDSKGIEINLSEKEIESIKAQLAIKNFKETIEIDQFKDLISDNSSFEDLKNTITENTKSISFSYTLDDWARAWGDMRNIDLNNYADLTALANAQHGANWSVEEYASAYQANVDVINALQSGDLSSFDAASLGESLGATLQDVADTITAASAAGVTVDLEAAAEGLGYDSFADAVAAYNEQYGTNYTVEQAREALGQ